MDGPQETKRQNGGSQVGGEKTLGTIIPNEDTLRKSVQMFSNSMAPDHIYTNESASGEESGAKENKLITFTSLPQSSQLVSDLRF